MTDQEKKNIYNAIQNLYNMDFKTWQEVLPMLYNLVADVNQKFDTFESKFEINLGSEVTHGIKKLHDDGKLNEIINAELLNELNDTVNDINNNVIVFKDDIHTSVNEFKDTVYDQLRTKANLNSIFSMANMGQDVKEAMTNGSVAVVGRNTILSENIVNGEIIPSKLSNVKVYKNKINKNAITYGCYYAGTTGTITPGFSDSGLNCVTDLIPCISGETYCKNKKSNVIFWDNSFKKIGNLPPAIGSFTIPEGVNYMAFSLIDTDVNSFQVELGEIATKYEEYNWSSNDLYVLNTDIVEVYGRNYNKISIKKSGTDIAMHIVGGVQGKGFTIYTIYSNKNYTALAIENDTNVILSHNDMWIYNIFSNQLQVKNLSSHKSINHREGDILLALNIDGNIVSGCLSNQLNNYMFINHVKALKIEDVYCRYNDKLNITKDRNTITLNALLGWSVYVIYKDNDIKYSSYKLNENSTWILPHNGMLIWNCINNTIKVEDLTKYSINYVDNKDLLLALNIDGNIVSGYLKDLINECLDNQNTKRTTDTKCSIGKFKFKFDVTLPISYMSSHVLVGDELWIFPVSNDEGTNAVTTVRYRMDFNNNRAELVGSFKHNWGHVNSSSYSPLTDSIICGNGSGSYSLMGQIFIFENASSFKDRDKVNRNEAITIDIQEFGYKCNVVWGEANGGKGNICYVVSRDNQNIRKLLLGQGNNQFENGVFLEGKTGLQFNGTYKILQEWTMPKIDVNQGTNYENGALYIGLGHSTIWFTKNSLHDDGTVSYKTYKEYRYDDTGAILNKNMQGITVTEEYIILGQDAGGTHEILVYYK